MTTPEPEGGEGETVCRVRGVAIGEGNIRSQLAERGITEWREQNKELWKMAHAILYGPLAEIFDELEDEV